MIVLPMCLVNKFAMLFPYAFVKLLSAPFSVYTSAALDKATILSSPEIRFHRDGGGQWLLLGCCALCA
jgi:hypothetical protein